MKITCCPQYTIKSQRKLINRWNRYILREEPDSPMEADTSDETSKSKKSGKKPQLKSPPFTSLSESLHASESNIHPELESTHTFEVTLEPASYTVQKSALYKKYQSEIHNDRKSSPSGFKRFLVDSPLQVEPIPYPNPPPSHLPLNYGSYHQLYKIDGQLMAVAVLDILPCCVSSVYFMYDNTWERFSLGKLSALREVSLAREIREAGAPEVSSLYMALAFAILAHTFLWRQARERREYVYAKSLEAQERQTWDRKQQLKGSLATGKTLPTELKKSAKDLGRDFTFDEAQAEPTTHIDNEYSHAGIEDPKIVITTSRDPSSKLLQFSKEMRLVFPNSHRINRGNYVVKELAEACRANDVTDLIVVHEHRGIPDALIVSHFPHGPTVYFTLNNVILRHDIVSYNKSTVSEQYPHLIFENFSSKLGERVRDVLKYLFPVPKEDSKRVMTFANEDDFISFR
ncbi:unnamed protein product [Cyclocybe aegerita]|uniref:U3 small nucleolar ribonucleoprotein protein IMP4 n=1 Tax=Cyclocybe aegerita TaxID=1973307 RepID=A0A8S0W2G6_CYCAE|nr:unnamed protein product [Cyclocybe aegerita]